MIFVQKVTVILATQLAKMLFQAGQYQFTIIFTIKLVIGNNTQTLIHKKSEERKNRGEGKRKMKEKKENSL